MAGYKCFLFDGYIKCGAWTKWRFVFLRICTFRVFEIFYTTSYIYKTNPISKIVALEKSNMLKSYGKSVIILTASHSKSDSGDLKRTLIKATGLLTFIH